MAITFDGETYILPHTVSVDLLQTDGSAVTLFSDSVVSGSATVSVLSVYSQTHLSSGGLSFEAGPASRGSSGASGASRFDGLIKALEGLAGTAISAVSALDQISDQGVRWAAGSLSNSGFGSSLGLFDSATADLSNFVSTMSGVFEDFSGEIYELENTEDGLRRVFPARTAANEELDLLRSLRKLLHNLVDLKGNVILRAKQYWIPGTAAASALAAARYTLNDLGSFPWVIVNPSTSSSITVTSTTTASNETTTESSSSTSASATASMPVRYLITSKDGTDAAVFKAYIKTLPDQGEGRLSASVNLPFQSYLPNLTAEQAKEVAEEPFINYVYPDEEVVEIDASVIPPEHLKPRALEDFEFRPDSDEHLRVSPN
jgi:hypothetical protein